MADHTLNGRKLSAQPALKRIYRIMYRADRQRGIDVAVKIDDFTGGSIPDPHVMNLTKRRERRCERGQQLANFGDARWVSIAAGQQFGR